MPTTIDKSAWADGEWQEEPDSMLISDGTYPIIIIRSTTTGALCGYVGAPRSHIAHGKQCDDVMIDVHGGLTYAGKWPGTWYGIKDRWWLGFDTAHAWDRMPAVEALMDSLNVRYGTAVCPSILWDDPYRNWDYVVAECRSLSEQLERMTRFSYLYDRLKNHFNHLRRKHWKIRK